LHAPFSRKEYAKRIKRISMDNQKLIKMTRPSKASARLQSPNATITYDKSEEFEIGSKNINKTAIEIDPYDTLASKRVHQMGFLSP
jgi:hypothetical protein